MSSARRARFVALTIALHLASLVTGTPSARAAEANTGTIVGTVIDDRAAGLADVEISASSPSGRYTARSDARGRFTIFGAVPDTYAVCAQKPAFSSACDRGLTVVAGQTQGLQFVLRPSLQTIGRASATSQAFALGAAGDVFAVSGAAARAQSPPASSTGLAQYARGTVQGAIASVPGVELDPFANAVVRATKAQDTIFDFDSVPIPQGLVAEPGGNVDGAQLLTTGVGATTVTLSGFTSESDNALGAVVNQIPAIGTYPQHAEFSYAQGIGSKSHAEDFAFLGASPDLRWRYALAAASENDGFVYGDGHTFYAAEAATNGVAIASRGSFSATGNVHYRAGEHDDIALLLLHGSAAYDQYGTPYPGQLAGAFDGTGANGNSVSYPGETNPNAPVTTASGIRGAYDVIKSTWLHTSPSLLSRVQLYRSRYDSEAGGPFWDENGFPNGSISLSERQGGTLSGATYDGDGTFGRHRARFGAEYRIGTSYLSQIVPTADEFIRSQPLIDSALVYAGDEWHDGRLTVAGTARISRSHIEPAFGTAYDTGGIDPHATLAYRLGSNFALRANFDHQTVAPLPLDTDRTDSANVDGNGNGPPFVPLAPESSNTFTYSLEGRGRIAFRLSYFQQLEKNVIDVLPYDYKAALANGNVPSGLGVPGNAGLLRSSGLEFYVKTAGFTLSANATRGFSSSASQFAFNDLNAPAIAAGHLFPIGYVPDFTAIASYDAEFARGALTVTPSLSFESGYRYGNGRMVWIFGRGGKPEQVPNDNYVNPGSNYYFLRDPSQPFDAASNPYIGSLGTNEGSDPNTLRSPAQLLANLHLEAKLAKRTMLEFDLTNAFGTFSATEYQANPYLIGPPGYKGGNAAYTTCYAQILRGTSPCNPSLPAGTPAYALGNGVPTNDGVTQAVPWNYGTAGYVPQSYPLGRTVELRLKYRL